MANEVWWKTNVIDGCMDEILKLSVDARIFYLKIDLKARIKRFIMFHEDFQDVVNIWKRLKIIRDDFGEDMGNTIINQVLKELYIEFSNPEMTENIIQKVTLIRKTLNDNSIMIV